MSESIKGINKLLNNLRNLEKDLSKKVDAITMANVDEMGAKAISYAPLDNGDLKKSIRAVKIDEHNWALVANATGLAPYAPYIEFGTGGLVDVPEELKDIAINFIGKGVKQVNIAPRPYMYPALVEQRPIYIKDLEELLKKEVAKL